MFDTVIIVYPIWYTSFPTFHNESFKFNLQVICSFALLLYFCPSSDESTLACSLLWLLGLFLPSFAPWCWPLVFFRQNWRNYHIWFCHQSGLLCICVAAAHRTCWSIPSVICTTMTSAQEHAKILFPTVLPIAWTASIIFLVFASAAILRADWKGVLSSLSFIDMIGTVGTCLCGGL